MIENILLALAGLKANKMRSLLTMLGIIIGISSVIGIICVGDSLTAYMTDTMNTMGAGNIIVLVNERGASVGGISMEATLPAVPSDDDLITDEQIDVFLERFNGKIKTISMQKSMGNGRVQDGRSYANVGIQGVNAGYSLAQDIDMTSGRFITERDSKGLKSVAVVSDYLVEAIFPPGSDPIGREIKVYSQSEYKTYTLVGVYHYVPSAFSGFSSRESRETRTDLYIPLGVANMDMAQQNHQLLTVIADSNEDTQQLTEEIRAYWRLAYERNPRWNVDVINMETMISTMGDMLGTLSTAVAIIAAISLLVGGIGVMNIMLVSVTERTREIGIRKALGARNVNIRMQFITEAMIICLIGGMIGILVGLAIGMIGSNLLGFPAAVSPGIIMLCVMFSMMVGIFFGSYPASKAAKLDPIEALRYE
ncbi:MAG: ABC transporter permease [Oscillospiraceae bacterium]|nr:ABC transporter permease [Oscillospiraceae bacterium]